MAVEYFNWQEAPERDLWKHLLPELMTAVSQEAMAEISDASENFTQVAVELKINGVAVDARKFFEKYEEGLETFVERRAGALLGEQAELADLRRLMDDFTAAMRERIFVAASDAGIEIPERY